MTGISCLAVPIRVSRLAVAAHASALRTIPGFRCDVTEVIAASPAEPKNHIVVIPRPLESGTDVLDSHCWRCGTDVSAVRADDVVLCRACRKVILAEPAVDAVTLARLAYWESHALRCCWRCMTRAVDPDDAVGMCQRCRERLVAAVGEGAT